MSIHHKVQFTNLRSSYLSSTDRRPSGEPLNLNLPSNNPFRNGAPSPSIRSEPSTSPGYPFVKDRPASRNPFFEALPVSENRSSTQSQQQGPRLSQSSAVAMPSTSEQKPVATSSTTELLVSGDTNIHNCTCLRRLFRRACRVEHHATGRSFATAA